MLLTATGDKHSPCVRLADMLATIGAATYKATQHCQICFRKGASETAADLVAVLPEYGGFSKVAWMDVYHHAVHGLFGIQGA